MRPLRLDAAGAPRQSSSPARHAFAAISPRPKSCVDGRICRRIPLTPCRCRARGARPLFVRVKTFLSFASIAACNSRRVGKALARAAVRRSDLRHWYTPVIRSPAASQESSFRLCRRLVGVHAGVFRGVYRGRGRRPILDQRRRRPRYYARRGEASLSMPHHRSMRLMGGNDAPAFSFEVALCRLDFAPRAARPNVYTIRRLCLRPPHRATPLYRRLYVVSNAERAHATRS